MDSVAAETVCNIRESVARRIGQGRFNAWFGNAVHFDLQPDELRVVVPNAFVGNWIAANYMSDLQAAAADIVGTARTVHVRVGSRTSPPGGPPTAAHMATVREQPAAAPAPAAPARLRGDLDTFVVGACNELAYRAALAVVDTPETAFRPLFLHGGCGLGKTHLLQGICNAVALHHPTRRWCYLSGEEFTNEFIYAVKAGRIDAFRARFRKVDLLLIDDIHFLANKRATQEEFLHTFNAIDGAGRTIVLTSDRHPRSIAQLSEPLINRLIAGMVCEISTPDHAVRLEVLRRRAAQMNVPIPEDVLELLARRITRNVRELEGALFKLAALASLAREDITVALARTALADYLTPEHGPIEVGDIELLVAQHFGISRERLRSASRDRTVSAARAVAMYLVRHHTNLSYPEIGRALGGKNHSTVVMAVQRIEQVIAADGSVRWKSPQGRHTEAPARTLLADLAARLERRGH